MPKKRLFKDINIQITVDIKTDIELTINDELKNVEFFLLVKDANTESIIDLDSETLESKGIMINEQSMKRLRNGVTRMMLDAAKQNVK